MRQIDEFWWGLAPPPIGRHGPARDVLHWIEYVLRDAEPEGTK
jgi:hypothetical protein